MLCKDINHMLYECKGSPYESILVRCIIIVDNSTTIHCRFLSLRSIPVTSRPYLKLYNYKFDSEFQRVVLAPVFMSWAIAEVHRFYFGCKGNIKEMVREGFAIFTP